MATITFSYVISYLLMVTLFARVWLNLHGEPPAPESWVGSHI